MMQKIPLVDLKAQYRGIKPEIDAAIARVLEHTGFILGEEVKRFESAFADHVGARGAVGVSSGTAALILALRACGVGPGDEVITTAHTFFATAEAISMNGARPVFVDIEAATYNIDPDQIEAAITPRTRAIIPVHLYGHPARMDAITSIADKHGLRVIEDSAQAHGAEIDGKPCGSIGDLACFSFYPGKNLGAYGDAGAVTGRDLELLQRVRLLRDHGRTAKYSHDEIGRSERMDGLQGAVLATKLAHLSEWTDARRRLASRYSELLSDTGLGLPQEASNVRHVYHLYVVRYPERDALLDHVKSRGIGAGIHYPIPLHRQPAYSQMGYDDVSLPVTEKAAEQVLSLPLFPELNHEQQSYVVTAIKEFVQR
ncbi:MAG: DegT/DnrJ/EryC1/StrS family aminotransferase [Proteobacteria bacterium]|nr:DegT/DnrJ/EryC1/StrS family aminotransferase [Pseudomonadota bacterium]